SFLEQRQELMLRAVEAAHASVGLSPDNEIEGVEAELRGGGEYCRIAPPVDERAQNAAVAKAGQDRLHPCRIEGEEIDSRHFARRHGELTMRAAGHMTRNRHVIRLVGEHEARGIVAFGESPKSSWVSRVAADDAVGPELEYVAEFCDRRHRRVRFK